MPAVLLAAALLAQAPAAAHQAVTTVDEVVVEGAYAEFRLVTDIGGELATDTLVVSSAPPMHCSGAAFQYAPGPARQCWLRARVNTPVRLEATARGRFGPDWTVEWTGCAPVGDGRACEITVTGEARVGAVFRRGRS